MKFNTTVGNKTEEIAYDIVCKGMIDATCAGAAGCDERLNFACGNYLKDYNTTVYAKCVNETTCGRR